MIFSKNLLHLFDSSWRQSEWAFSAMCSLAPVSLAFLSNKKKSSNGLNILKLLTKHPYYKIMVEIIIICYALTVCYKVINLQSRPFPVNKFCAQKDPTKLDRKKKCQKPPFWTKSVMRPIYRKDFSNNERLS